MIAAASEPTLPTEFHATICKLPPLILHPFSDVTGPQKLADSSRASLKMLGLLPSGDATRNDLEGIMLDGRYSEMRMLYYVGKDINRWVEQCLDCVRRSGVRMATEVRAQGLLNLLIHSTPAQVQAKLQKWGVSDYRALFGRSIGLNLIFASAPDRATVSHEFILNYYRYCDQIFSSYQLQTPQTQLDASLFHFELYSSGEYSRFLERLWEAV